MTDRSESCVVCGTYLRSGTGRWQEGRSLYARLDGKTIRVGAACDKHFAGERREWNAHYEGTHAPCRSRVGSVYLEWKDPTVVRLDRGTDEERAPRLANLLRDAAERNYPFGRDQAWVNALNETISRGVKSWWNDPEHRRSALEARRRNTESGRWERV